MSSAAVHAQRLSAPWIASLDVHRTSSDADAVPLPEDTTFGFRHLLEQLGEMHDEQVRALIAENKKLQLKLQQAGLAVEHAIAEQVAESVAPAFTDSDQSGKLVAAEQIIQEVPPKQTHHPSLLALPTDPAKSQRKSGRSSNREFPAHGLRNSVLLPESGSLNCGAGTDAFDSRMSQISCNSKSSVGSLLQSAIHMPKSAVSPPKLLKPDPKDAAWPPSGTAEPSVLSMAAMRAAWCRRQKEHEAFKQLETGLRDSKQSNLAPIDKIPFCTLGSPDISEDPSRYGSFRSECSRPFPRTSKPSEIKIEPWSEWTESKMSPGLCSSVERSLYHHSSQEGQFHTYTYSLAAFYKTPRTLHPNGRKRLVWDLLSCSLIVYDVISIPLVTGFGLQEVDFFIFTDWITLIFWTIDVFLSSITGFYRDGQLQMQPRSVFKHYFLTWFFPDLLVIGIDWTFSILHLMSQSASNIKVVRTFRILRFGRAVRFLRLLKVGNFIQAIHDQISTEATSIFFDLAAFTLALLVMTHVIGCMWHGIGLIGDDGSASAKSWLRKHDMADETFSMRYFTCLHWSLCFFLSNMEIQVQSLLERIYTVIVLVLALLVFSSFLSMVTSSCIQLWNMRNDKRRQFWYLRRYLREKFISKVLAMRVEQYLKIVYESDESCVREDQVLLLKLLSEPLQDELRFESMLPFLGSHALFRKNLNTAKELVNACVEMRAATNDMIVEAGDQADRMLLISDGTAIYHAHSMERDEDLLGPSSVEGPGSGEAVHLKEYDWICEGPLWTPWVYLGSLEATSICQLINIDSKTFREIAAKHFVLWQTFGSYAAFFCKYMAQRMLDGELVTDLPDDDLAYAYFHEQHNLIRSSLEALRRKMSDAKRWSQSRSMFSIMSAKINMSVMPVLREGM